ncbi:MAG: universal stress protein [Bdellovibrionales bacterium]|nr:universal stress protein [Bdellovibrionales bacterium]
MHFDTVLVTTDLSEDSFEAFDFAAYQAKTENSRVVLLYTTNSWEIPPALARHIPNSETLQTYQDDLKVELNDKLSVIAQERFHGVKVDTMVVISSRPASEEIVSVADKINASLIVIASHGRGAVGQMFLGSVVDKVIKLASCPVLVIPRKTN